MSVSVALGLAGAGVYVFPVGKNKAPLTAKGMKDATVDEGQIRDWWTANPEALIGVHTGRSNMVVLDLDYKTDGNGHVTVDGFTSLDEAWLSVPVTFAYDSVSGKGRHMVYRAPSGVVLNRQIGYRGMKGVDRLAGEGYAIWGGGVPKPEDMVEAPEWLCDVSVARETHRFGGGLNEWLESLVPGAPNLLVRNAISRIKEDMTHSEMVEAQHSAIRLGAEGNPGVPDLLVALMEAWLNRPAGNHTTPEDLWVEKFEEALHSGLEKFGDLTERLRNLPEYNIGMVPADVKDSLVIGEASGKAGFSKLLGALVKAGCDDDRTASILWSAPATRDIAREWGLDFVYTRIEEARVRPEPTRENPKIEDRRELALKNQDDLSLLTGEERAYIAKRPTFVDNYVAAGKSTGFANETYFRASAWTVASMAFSFHGFLPVTATDRMGLNLWNMVLGYSGSGKSRSIKFRDMCLRMLFNEDNADGAPYDLGTDSSPQGLHLSLLQRDRKASIFAADEASGFFKQLNKTDWMSSLDDTLSRWYEGFVEPSSKISLKEYRGKSATTALSIQMFATPDRLTEVLTRDMFLTGFLARFTWVLAPKPEVTDDRFRLLQQVDTEDFDEHPEVIKGIVSDLVEARSFTGGKPVPIVAERDALDRMSEAYKKMYYLAQHRENWDIIEPSVTRLSETMRKCAAIAAMYRSSDTITMADALHAINAVEEWFATLFDVAGMISSGEFQKNASNIEQWIRSKGGTATRAAIFNRFQGIIKRDSRELDSLVTFLVESGAVNREEDGRGIRYALNGG